MNNLTLVRLFIYFFTLTYLRLLKRDASLFYLINLEDFKCFSVGGLYDYESRTIYCC